MRKAPWSDFGGRDIHAGNVLRHPSGECGTVVFFVTEQETSDQWRVIYHDGIVSRLCLQIGNKGRANVTYDSHNS